MAAAAARSENVGGLGMFPSGGPRPFRSPPVSLILPCMPRTVTDGLPWASPGPALGEKSRNQGPQAQEVLSLDRVIFLFLLNFIWKKKKITEELQK